MPSFTRSKYISHGLLKWIFNLVHLSVFLLQNLMDAKGNKILKNVKNQNVGCPWLVQQKESLPSTSVYLQSGKKFI